MNFAFTETQSGEVTISALCDPLTTITAAAFEPVEFASNSRGGHYARNRLCSWTFTVPDWGYFATMQFSSYDTQNLDKVSVTGGTVFQSYPNVADPLRDLQLFKSSTNSITVLFESHDFDVQTGFRGEFSSTRTFSNMISQQYKLCV